MGENAPSRRGFLTTAGVAAAGGALSVPVNADRRTAARNFTVTRSRSLRPLSNDQRTAGAGDVTLSVSEADTATGFERFVAGETDILHATRPVLPEEARAAATNGVEYEALESAVDGVALLAESESGWRSYLSDGELARRLRDGSEVQVWSELVEPGAGPALVSPAAVDGTGDGVEGDLPPSVSSVVVRGVRADQYATGFGGLAHYDAATGELEPVDGDGSGTYLPLARVRYTYAEKTALRDVNVRSALRSATSRRGAAFADLVPYVDPADRVEAVGERASALGG